MSKILVTGANGQLGKCLQKWTFNHIQHHEFLFLDSKELDITNEIKINTIFNDYKPDYCINAAAYTAVDLAEIETEKAESINSKGVGLLAEACKNQNSIFIHISTDYVFDGESSALYTEESTTNPQNSYGKSKLKGENLALEIYNQSIIIRTSWLYSEFNKNFVKTMLHLFNIKEELNIVADQYGQPTNANDLAEAIMLIIDNNKKHFGVFHYSNSPETTWYHFAKKIAEFSKSKIILHPITTAEFKTPAVRPKNSTMDITKIKNLYNIPIYHWEESLQKNVHTLLNDQ